MSSKTEKELSIFNSEIKNVDRDIHTLKVRYQAVSVIRLAVFFAAAFLVVLGAGDKNPIAGIFGVILLLLFVYLVKLHADINDKMEQKKAKRTVLTSYIKRIDGTWGEFPEDGSMFVRVSDTVVKDIDLIGKNSLYQMMCAAHTDMGKRRLAKTLRLEDAELGDIAEKRNAVHEIAQNVDFAIDFETLSLKAEGRMKKHENMEFPAGQEILPASVRILRFIIPIVNAALIITTIAKVTSYAYIVLSFFISLFITWILKSATDRMILPYYVFGYAADEYMEMFKCIASQDFKSSIMRRVHEDITGEKGALSAMAKIRSISQAFNISYNPLMHLLFSGFLAWDCHIAAALKKWNDTYGNNFEGCFNDIAEVEELISLATLEHARSTVTAGLRSDTDSLICENIYHPLIDIDKVVANTVTIRPGVTVITGSNMSGKTTFLRTLAINLVLAYIGAGVCAERFSAGYMKIFTSMRVTDDVAGGVSTFYAEILRIKGMVDYMRSGDIPMICFIDEIFKGTNSADRLVGAEKVIKKLSESGGITMVSTHDFELCDIKDSEGNKADNYHFEEYYEDEKLKFDYRIKTGRCETRNAMAILKMAGLS